MKMLIIAACFLLLFTFPFTKSFAQGPYRYHADTPDRYWLDLGVGKSSSGYSSVVWDANIQISDTWFVTGRLEGEPKDISSFGFNPGVGIYSYDILAGKILNRKSGFFTISAGLGIVQVVSKAGNDNNNSKTNSYTLGLPILVQRYFTLAPPVGFGIGGYINLNTIRPTAGITLNLAIGHFAYQ